MKEMRFLIFVAVITLSLAGFAQAVVISSYDWNYVEGAGQASQPLVRVTEMFFTAWEIEGSKLDETPGVYDNLFLYSVQNVSANAPINIFSVPNPDNVSAVMFSPAHPTDPGYTPQPWDMREEAGRFLWEAPSAFDYIDPGETMTGFELFTVQGTAERGVLSSPPYDIDSIGWAHFLLDVNVYGSISGPVAQAAPVPEPAGLLLLGSGLIGLGFLRKRSVH